MIKISIMIKRRPDLTHREFREYWLESHAPKIVSLPNVLHSVKRYVQQIAINDLPEGLPITDFDGVAELWFDDVQSAMNVMASEEYIETIPTDEPNFIDPSATRMMITKEIAII